MTSQVHFGAQPPPAREHGGRLPVALVTPVPERAALSALGWQAVMRLLLDDDGFAPERFHPALEGSKSGQGAARSLESGAPLASFPLAAMSAAFEEDVAALARILKKGGVPALSQERPSFPLVLVGGPMAFLNPAPLIPLADLFFVGEAEAGLVDLMRRFRTLWLDGADKEAFLNEAARLPSVLVPGRSRTPVRRAAAVTDASGRELDAPAHSLFVSPTAEFKDMLLVEVNRGCPHSCRFCAAGHIYRPPRRARMKDLLGVIEESIPRAKVPLKVGLVGTALTDWPDLLPFLRRLVELEVKFSLSSVRADGLGEEVVEFLRSSGIRTLTLALEAPSERLRRAACKNLKSTDFLAAVERCARFGINKLKVYLIVGWPGETDEDYDELETFLGRMAEARDQGLALAGKMKSREMVISISATSLVPKPFTPMQWAPMASEADLKLRLDRVKSICRPLRAVQFFADKPGQARLQGLLARGGEELAPLALAAADKGWKRAFREWEGDEAAVLDRERGGDEVFPWEVVDPGVDRESLWRQWLAYKEGTLSPPCPEIGCRACPGCGIQKLLIDEDSATS